MENTQTTLASLGSYEFGQSREPLSVVEEQVSASNSDLARRKALEAELVALLGKGTTPDVKEFACRQLSLIGSAPAVPALVALLAEAVTSDMGLFALQRIPDPSAAAALRDVAGCKESPARVGAINSLGERQDHLAVPLLAKLVQGEDSAIINAAAHALGKIGGHASQAALASLLQRSSGEVRINASLALMACATTLPKGEAVAIHERLFSSEEPLAVQLGALNELATLKGKAALPLLRQAAQNHRPKIRAAARKWIDSLGG